MHPSLRLVLLVALAIAVQAVELKGLVLIGTISFVLALKCHVTLLRKILYRSRWLLVTLMLIYGFTTPGEYIAGLENLSLTYEGLQQGAIQATRLAIMLSGLALLLGTTPRDDLMAGIYQIIQPTKYLGMAPDSFTARLWLTMHYIEMQQPIPAVSFQQRFDSASGDVENASLEPIRLMLPAFTTLDRGILLLMVVILIWILV